MPYVMLDARSLFMQTFFTICLCRCIIIIQVDIMQS